MSGGDFVDLITHGQPAAPSYFSVDVAMNKRVHPLLDQSARSRIGSGSDPQGFRRRRTGGGCPR
jgi:hypothetical protein